MGTQAVTFDAPLKQATTVPVAPAGVTFDSVPTSQPTSVSLPGQPSAQTQNTSTQPSQQSSAIPDALNIEPTDNPVLKYYKGLDAVGAGIGEGLLGTLNGGASMLHLPHATLEQRAQQLQQQNAGNPILNDTGEALDTIGEFLSGDEALKGLALSDRLLKTSKIAKVLESSPLLQKAVTIGINAMRAGTVQGTIGTVASGGDVKRGLAEGAGAAAISGGLGLGGATISAIRNATDLAGVQAPLQQGIRNLISDAATKAGVSAPTAASIRDVAQQTSDAIENKASALYKTLDDISGGRAQRFRDALRNVNEKLGDIVGIDDDKEAELAAKKAEIEAAHQKMLNDLEAQGHDRNTLAQADAAWKQQSALSDVNNAIRQSASGLRPELANTNGAQSTPESLNPKTLFTKVNRLYDRGRLQQAIGQENAENLLRHIDNAYVQSQRVVDHSRWLSALKKTAIGAAGLAAAGTALGGAHHFAHELLGSE